MTAHGLPTEEVFALFNRAQNLGPTDGVSQTSTASPTSVLVTLAAGRNPTDITLPTVGSEGAGGDEEDDAVAASSGTTDAAASPSSSSASVSSTATASAGSSGGGSSGATAKAPAAGSSGAPSAGSSGSNAAVEGGSGNAAGEGEVAPTDETGGGDEGGHLTAEEITIFAANGYALANIKTADDARANGASYEMFKFLLGRPAQDQAANNPLVALSARTTDEVVMQVVEKAEPVVGPYMVRGGAILNAAGDVGAIYLGVSMALAPEASIPTVIGGALLAAASADDLGANSVTLVTAEPQQSVVQSGVRAGALKLGSSEQDAQNLEQLSTIFLRSTQVSYAAMVFPPAGVPGPNRIGIVEAGQPGEVVAPYSAPAQTNSVFRGLAAGANPAAGLSARAPGAGNSVASHVAGKRASQWISATTDEAVASGRFGGNGVVEIDLSKVNSEVLDISQGIPGMEGTMLSNWAAKMKEVLIRDYIPPDAIKTR